MHCVLAQSGSPRYIFLPALAVRTRPLRLRRLLLFLEARRRPEAASNSGSLSESVSEAIRLLAE